MNWKRDEMGQGPPLDVPRGWPIPGKGTCPLAALLLTGQRRGQPNR